MIIAGVLLVVTVFMAACSQTTAPPEVPTAAASPTPVFTQAPTEVPAPEVTIPFEEQWAASPHNQADSEAFVHWNEEDPAEVPPTCASCHTSAGYVDYISDGTVDAAVQAPAGTITCEACHSEAAVNLSSVTFLSTEVSEDGTETPVTISGLDASARCMVCHQGRATKTQVDAQIARFEVTDPDAVVEPIEEGETTAAFNFINIHYYAAAVTLYGKEVHGGYEYDGKLYDAKNDHVENFDSCVECHDSHTLEVKIDQCAQCHEGVASTDDLKNIREISSASDYDGDGDVEEGMFNELEGLREALLGAIQAYAKDTAGTAIAYNPATHPYFFIDTNDDGQAQDDEAVSDNRYSTWTARLLKAAYNYQVSTKDPGAYAHGNKYIVQLLYDSIEDLSGDVSALTRDDAGHFAGNTEAFRHWDAEGGVVPAGCAKCHSASGMPQFIANGGVNVVNRGTLLTTGVVAAPASNGLACASCHDEANWPERYAVTQVSFPSGANLTFSEADADGNLQPADANLCIECHQGRESTVSVNAAINGLPADEPNERVRFRNIHYFAAGASLFGDEAKGAYQFDGQTYLGRFLHVQGVQTCTDCHDAHALAPIAEKCQGCHQTDDPATIRGASSTADYDGDGDTTEGIAGEISTLHEALYAALQAYAADTLQAPLVYNAVAYPYFFADANGNAEIDEGEGAYATWSPKLLQSAFNYQFVEKDPGSYVHNGKYIIQILYDSIRNVGGNVSSYTRP